MAEVTISSDAVVVRMVGLKNANNEIREDIIHGAQVEIATWFYDDELNQNFDTQVYLFVVIHPRKARAFAYTANEDFSEIAKPALFEFDDTATLEEFFLRLDIELIE